MHYNERSNIQPPHVYKCKLQGKYNRNNSQYNVDQYNNTLNYDLSNKFIIEFSHFQQCQEGHGMFVKPLDGPLIHTIMSGHLFLVCFPRPFPIMHLDLSIFHGHQHHF